MELFGGVSFTTDASPGGFCAESMRVLRPGTDIHGKIRVGEEDVEFTGKIAWAKAAEPRLQIRGRMGIRLTGVGASYYRLF